MHVVLCPYYRNAERTLFYFEVNLSCYVRVHDIHNVTNKMKTGIPYPVRTERIHPGMLLFLF